MIVFGFNVLLYFLLVFCGVCGFVCVCSLRVVCRVVVFNLVGITWLLRLFGCAFVVGYILLVCVELVMIVLGLGLVVIWLLMFVGGWKDCVSFDWLVCLITCLLNGCVCD